MVLVRADEISALALRLESEPALAIDTEFIRETSFFPKLELIQIGTRTETFLIDGRATREALQPIRRLLENPKILKVLHAATSDQECFYTAMGCTAKPVFDTAIGAALCGLGEQIGLAPLLKQVLSIKLPKGHARTNWGARPLPPELQAYARADVEHLLEVTDRLFADLDRRGRRDWALELSLLSANPALYDVRPQELSDRLYRSGKVDARDYPLLYELVSWREERVRAMNIPRRWFAEDRVLTDLVQVKPKSVDQLKQFRGLHKGELNQNGDAIVARIQRAVENPNPELKAPKLERPASAQESRVMDLLRVFMGVLADEYEISTRYLAVADQLLAMIRLKAERTDQWVEAGILTAGAARLMGDEVLAFLRGERTLRILEGRLKIDRPA